MSSQKFDELIPELPGMLSAHLMLLADYCKHCHIDLELSVHCIPIINLEEGRGVIISQLTPLDLNCVLVSRPL